MSWIESIVSQIASLLGQGQIATLAALFFITLLAEIGVPFPFIPDSALFLAGYQSGFTIHSLYTFLIVFSARLCGSSLTYVLSHILGRNLLSWIGNHFPRIHKRIAVITEGSSTHIPMTIAFLRLGGLLYLPSIAAGVIRLPFRHLILGVALSSLIFDGATIILGMLTSHGFRILGFTPTNSSVIVGFIIIMVIALLIQVFIARRKRMAGSDN